MQYSFLDDINTVTWGMTVVKKIICDDATLVRKGAFLSIPGAKMKVYHQDGFNLNQKQLCYSVYFSSKLYRKLGEING